MRGMHKSCIQVSLGSSSDASFNLFCICFVLSLRVHSKKIIGKTARKIETHKYESCYVICDSGM